MAKLHQQLETLFGARFNSNDEIIATIKKLSEAGKFDEPKKVAVFALILDRLGKMEDEIAIVESLKTDDNATGADPLIDTSVTAPLPDDFQTIRETQLETPVETVPVTSPDAIVEPEVTPPAQTPIEPTPEVPAVPETPVTDTPTPPVEPVIAQDTANLGTNENIVTEPPATDSPTVAKFTPENITDPVTPPDPTTSS